MTVEYSNFKRYLCNGSSDQLRVSFRVVFGNSGSNGSASGWTKSKRQPPAVFKNFEWPYLWNGLSDPLSWIREQLQRNIGENNALPIVNSERTASPTGFVYVCMYVCITLRHSRAMNVFSGKGHFLGCCSSKTQTDFREIWHDYVSNVTPHANFKISKCKSGFVAHAWSCLFLTLMCISAGRLVGPSTAVNSSNYAPRLELHFLYGLHYKNSYILPFLPQNSKIGIAAYGDFERLSLRHR